MQNGDVVFFKSAKKASNRKAPEVKFKGHAFGVLLGHVPPFQKDPQPEHLLRLMGTIGFLTFDDVGEFLGDEMAQKCVKMYEDKYYGKEAQLNAEELPPVVQEIIDVPENPGLLDSKGVPLEAVRGNNEPTV